ncbi:MAG: hypothetical protein HWE30_03635 [Methylocystaceae bacterium]|nr:hypothetical protein [Methylocystaceae bacterium]
MSKEIFIPSNVLSLLREFLEAAPELQKIVGLPTSFKVVLDANMAAADLLHKIKRPDVSETSIEECAIAGVLEVHAPRWLDHEMTNSTIPQLAKKKKMDEVELQAMWVNYKQIVQWDESLLEPPSEESSHSDHKDVPYVELQEKIDAIGILSRDKHIGELGGRKLKLEFVMSARRYARAETVQMSLHIGGVIIGTISLEALKAIIGGIKNIYDAIPPALKVIAFVFVAYMIINPEARASIVKKLGPIGDFLSELIPEIGSMMAVAIQKKAEAHTALSEIDPELSPILPLRLDSNQDHK